MTIRQLMKTGFFIGVGLAAANLTFQFVAIAVNIIARNF